MTRRVLPFIVSALIFAAAISTAHAQTSRFRYSPERVPVGTVYHYTKSNLDGSNPWRLSTYVASRTHIDVIKWAGGPGELVNVMADFNWQSAVVEHVEQWNPRGGAMGLTMAGDLTLDGRSLTFTLAGGQSLTMTADTQPLHVYGFDLQSLNMAYRHLADPTRTFEVGFVGNNRHISPEHPEPVAYMGRTVFEYAGEEQALGFACRKYKMTGPGMEGKDGWVWFDRDAGHLVKIESPWPASNDWTTYRLELNKVERMTPFAWQEMKGAVVASKTRGAVPFRAEMEKAYRTGGLDAALKLYPELERAHARAPEGELNGLAYVLMEGGKAADAAALLEFALAKFPGSANLHDSLGEAYMKAGNRELAIKNYKRSLELDSTNDNARDMLKKLEAGR